MKDKIQDMKIIVNYDDGTRIECRGGKYETAGELILRSLHRSQIDHNKAIEDILKAMNCREFKAHRNEKNQLIVEGIFGRM